MTNEQLATFIHAGGNDELIPLLWEKVQRFVYYKARSVYNSNTTRCQRCGVELWDIQQAGYIAFIEAIRGYKPEPGYKFITFIQLPFKNAVNDLLKLKTQKQRHEPLNNCISLDTPTEDADGDTDTTLIDLQADETSTDFINELEAGELRETIRAEIEKLSERERDVIKLFYFQSKSLQEISKQMGVSGERVRQLRSRAERELRQSQTLKKIYNDFFKQRGRDKPKGAVRRFVEYEFRRKHF